MEGKKEIDFSKKFKNLMGEESTYEFFLKMQYVMPKYAQKKDPIFFSFIIFAIKMKIKIFLLQKKIINLIEIKESKILIWNLLKKTLMKIPKLIMI